MNAFSRAGRQDVLDPDVLAQLATIVGPAHVVTDVQAMEPYLVEERGLYRGAYRCSRR